MGSICANASEEATTSPNQGQQQEPETKVESSADPTASDLNLVLYANGFYEVTKYPNAEWAEGIKQSDFNTIILWTLHVQGKDDGGRKIGDLVYNDNVIVSDGKLQSLYGASNIDLKSKIQDLRSTGKVKRVLFSIGSGGVPDWQTLYNIVVKGSQQLQDTLYANFKVLIDLGIDGFDSDCEEFLTPQLIETHVNLFSHLYQSYPQLIFTFVPYYNEAGWIEIAAQLYKKCGTQIVKFWSLQCYSGGAGNSVLEWIAQIGINKERLGLSADEVEKYIVPGFDSSVDSPSTMQQKFTGLKGKVNGGMVWNLTNTFTRSDPTATLKQYSDAIINGLT